MKTLRSLFGTLFLIMAFLCSGLTAYAAQAAPGNLVVHPEWVRAGQQVEVTFSLGEFEATEDGIHALTGTLSYDSTVFQPVDASDFVTVDGWESLYYNPDNGRLVVIHKTGDNDGGAVFRLTLTATADLKAQETAIAFSQVSFSEGQEDLLPKDSSVSVQVIGDSGSSSSGNTDPAPQPSAPQTGGNGTSPAPQPSAPQTGNTGVNPTPAPSGSLGNNTDADPTSQPTSPQAEATAAPTPSPAPSQAGQATDQDNPSQGTGLMKVCVGIAVILLVLLLLALLAARRGRLSKKISWILAVLLIAGILAALLGGVAYGMTQKGDLNQDHTVDYTDVMLLEKHLIELETLEESVLPSADMNNDNHITVTDLALLIRAAEKNLVYEVHLSSMLESRYFEKNQQVEIPFQAQVTNQAQIAQVVVNGETYDVTRSQDGSSYTLMVQTGETAGELPLHFTQVTLVGGQQVKVDFTETLEILKDVPAIRDFTVEELVESAQMQAHFVLDDPDNAHTSAILELTYLDENTLTILQSQTVQPGENTVILNLPEGKVCTLSICAEYDRTMHGDSEAHTGSTDYSTKLQLNVDYGFQFSHLKALNEQLQETLTFSKNEPIVLEFHSTNLTKFIPQTVTVNGQNYPVTATEEDGVYRLELPGFDHSGDQVLQVERVVLSNGKVFPLDNTSLTVQIQKTMPTVENLTVVESQAGQSLDISFSVHDPDGALSNRKVVVRQGDGQLIVEQPFTDDAFAQTLELPGSPMTAAYTVEVVADCDISMDGSMHQPDQVLAQETVEALPRVEISHLQLDQTYYEKGAQATMTVQLVTNRTDTVKNLVVNNLDLPAQAQENGQYTVTLPVSNQAGPQAMTLSQVVFTDDTIVPVHAQQQIQILRDLPVVVYYETQDDFDQSQIQFSFEIRDPDQAMVEGIAVLTADDGSEAPVEYALTQAGMQNFRLSVTENKAYTLTVTLNSQRGADGTHPVEEQVLQSPVQLFRDYALEVSELTPVQADGTPNPYFEKGAPVLLSFTSHNSTSFVPEVLFSGETEYPVTKTAENTYTIQLPAGSQAGTVTFGADALRLSNGKLLSIPNGRQAQYEILKDAPQVDGFAYEKTEQDELQVRFTIQDPDHALESAHVRITDELGKVLLDGTATEGLNENTIPLSQAERYTIQITATYDRDTNALDQTSNRYTDDELYTQEMTATPGRIELKDVESHTLYLRTDSGSQKVSILDITQGLPTSTENYYAVIEMKDLPDLYAGIQEFRLDEKTQKLYAVLDQENLIVYHEDGSRSNRYSFQLNYRDQNGDHVLVESASQLFAQMSQNLNGNFELTCDLDASEIPTTDYAIPGTFSGTLNGNGHTIYNLPVTLFQKLSRATVTNLVLEDAMITTNHPGILAGSIDGQSLVEQVFLVDCTLRNNSNMVGGFAGSLTNATLRHSAAINLTIRANNTIGGLVGQTNSGSRVENCYVTGQLQGTISHNLGARVGGITGWHNGTIIQHCLTNVTITAPSNTGNGGIIGGPNSATNSKISHCVSLGGGTAYRIAGFTAALNNADAVYEYTASNSTTNRTEANADRILQVDTLTREFYADTLGLDPQVWALDLAGRTRLPSLVGDPLPKTQEDYDILENVHDIPNYQRVRQNSEYQADRDMAYANLAKLMPFADTADWVSYGNALPADHVLVTQTIRSIFPVDEAGELVTGLDTQTPGAVQRIRMVFTDYTSQDVSVTYQKTLGTLVAVYQTEFDLPYQFRGYVKDLTALGLDSLAATMAQWDYQSQIASLTSEDESRLYADHYTEAVQPKLDAVLRHLVLSQQEYPAYSHHGAVQSLVAQRLQDTDALKEYLYAYNYYDKWYNFQFDGVSLSQLLLFAGDLVHPALTTDQLTQQLLQASSALRGTGRTYDYYTQTLQPYTGKEMLAFLAQLAKTAGFNDPSDWFAAEFDGILVEQAPNTDCEGIEYRIWHAFNTLGGRRQIILPIMSAPQEDMYILSVPSQLILGSMNRYETYLQKDGSERERMRTFIENFAQRYAHFYGISANWISNGPDILNSFVNIQYDTRHDFPAGSVAQPGEQIKGSTQDPVIKWVYEAVGSFSTATGVGAYANGTDVYCVAYPAVGYDFTFYIMTHETAHNQDGRYFYAGYGRRSGSGAEAHADGNIAQQIEDGSMVFNISRVCDPASDVTNNFSYERIRTPDQVWDYYANMFETSYVIDYLAGQAFLQLTPEEQARVAIQVTHKQEGSSVRSIYTRLTADQLRAMQLKDMSDLWDNKIALKAPGDRASASGAYGYESFYDVNWYQPHFDQGAPDSSSFKRLAQEMLGIAGYMDGYVTYISASSANDLEALRTITGDPNITWRSYKLGRYSQVASQLDQIPYFEPDQVIQQFMQAFRTDNDSRNNSIALQRTLFGIVKRATGDFTTGGIYSEDAPIRIRTAEELIQAVQSNPMGYYLLEQDLDFSSIPASTGAYISTRFIGTLDGNGHRMTGVSRPLFQDMVYGQIMDLTIEAPSYNQNATAYLAVSAKNTVISNVQVQQSNITLPMVKQTSGGYYQWGDTSSTILEKTISTVEEFLAIGHDETNKKMCYVLANDLDFQGVSLDAAAVSGVFSGKLDGNGHSILNLTAPLFEQLDGAQILNVNLAGANLTQNRYKGLVANTVSGSLLENIRISGSTLSNNSNQVGMLAGLIRNSTLKRLSLTDITVSANNTVGGVAGQIDGSTLENCLVTGSVRGFLANNSLGSRAGGITGWLSTNTTLNNCYVRAEISGAVATGNGGLIGGPGSGAVTMRNSVSLSTGATAYRLSGFPVLGKCENLYELETSNSVSNWTESNQDRVKQVSEAQAQDPDFYTNQLGWSEKIWDFSQVATGGTPILR